MGRDDQPGRLGLSSDSTLRDRWILAALAVGFLLRILPFFIWFNDLGCTRDECLYDTISEAVKLGEGMQRNRGWMWAPGYAYTMAAAKFSAGKGVLRLVQVVLSTVTIAMVAQLAEPLGDRKSARWAAWLMALNPTLIFFATRLWPETIYITLITGATLALLWSREGTWKRALLPGMLLGLCVLYRGVATFLAPVFALAVLWPVAKAAWGDSVRANAGHAAALLLTAALVVAPYSISASARHGGLIISDATAGQMAWQGNNTFAPRTFDHGLQPPLEVLRMGRPHCDEALPVAQWNACELRNAADFVAEDPVLFARRIPLRLAQLLNPNSFLTRTLREGRLEGVGPVVTELLCVWVVLWSLLVMWGGTVGAWARARGVFGAVAVGSVLYHLAVIACLAGMTRFRLPLEPLWTIYLALALSQPALLRDAFEVQGWRLAGLLLTAPALVYLCLRLALVGFAAGPVVGP